MWTRLVLFCTLMGLGYSYETGPPIDDPLYATLCKDMFPVGHNASALPNPGPFRVDVSRNCYCDNEILSVTYNSLNQSKDIEGIFIQARPYVSNERGDVAVGEFHVDHDPVLKTLDCFNMEKSAASHMEEKKKLSRTFLWRYNGGSPKPDIKFYATVLIHRQEFWTFVESATIAPCDTCSTITLDQCLPRNGRSSSAPPSARFQALFLLVSIFIAFKGFAF